ncbi:MAG: aminotransferase class I/II-fold pyridoxal phosphate-dependent enzyme [Coriobacteriales bacterium]|jgi:cystathionine beta-lyase|nr:aminotransferase class I/II-fold pyridoxal phosphate-dependent enzyme [Coriobacteriales bacterium]
MTSFDLDHPISHKNGAHPGAIGAGVAEMDFALAAPIRDALTRNVEASAVGYVDRTTHTQMLAATAQWLARNLNWEVSPKDVLCVADVLSGFEAVLRSFTAPDAPILIPAPAYNMLLKTPRYFGRVPVAIPCPRSEDGRYLLDFSAIDELLVPGALFVLTNPWNPTGQVYTRNELEQLAQLIARHDALVFADEVHCPLILNKACKHIPYASLSGQAAAHSITAISASKAWNIAGLKTAQLIISSPPLRQIWRRVAPFYALGASRLGLVANIAAYTNPKSQTWLDRTLDVLRENHATLRQHFAQHHPAVSVSANDATYLAWLDFRALELRRSPADFLLEHAQVVANDGTEYGAPGFLRFNFALEPPTLKRALQQITQALESY